MYLVTFVSLIAILLTYLESKNVIKYGMLIGFILVSILGILHYDYGNDYMAYYELYKDIVSYSFNLESIFNGEFFRDPAWVILCYIFKPVGGFFMMVSVLTIIQNTIIYKFIKSEVTPNWRPIALFIYLFTTSLYLMSFSMLRQSLVMCVFLGIWPLIKNRKWMLALLILYVCSLIHSSAYILMPFAFWGFISFKKGKFWAIAFAVTFVVLWASKSLLQDIFDRFLMIEQLSSYGRYMDKGREALTSVGIGYIIKIIPFIVGEIYFLKSESINNDKSKVLALSMVGFMVTPFTQIIDLFSRFSFYFDFFSMATIPFTYQSIKNKYVRYSVLFLFVSITILDYTNFFSNPMWSRFYGRFNTIIPHII